MLGFFIEQSFLLECVLECLWKVMLCTDLSLLVLYSKAFQVMDDNKVFHKNRETFLVICNVCFVQNLNELIWKMF